MKLERIVSTKMPYRSNGRKERSYKKLEPFYCKGCDKVWQPLRDYGNITDYLIGFPKIGCTEKICVNCKKKEK